MAKWWEYEAWRRRALQGIMWGLFGVMLAMACGLSAYRDGGTKTEVAAGPFNVRLTGGWTVTRPASPGALVAVVNETKPRGKAGLSQRQLFVYYKSVPEGTNVLDFLAGERSIGFGGLDERDQLMQTEIGSDEGVFIVNPRYKPTGILTGKYEGHYIGAVVLEDGSALAIRMYCKEPPSAADAQDFQRLLHRVTRSD